MVEPSPKHETGFSRFVRQVGELRLSFNAIVAAIPFLDLFVKFGPNYPSRAAIAFAASLISVVLFIVGYVFLLPRSIGAVRTAIKVSLTLFAIFAVLYVCCFFILTVDIPGDRVIKGLVYTKKAQDVLTVLPDTPDSKLIEFADGFDPDEIWTSSSLTITRLLMIGLWLSLFGTFQAIVVSFGTLSVKQEQSKAARSKKGGARSGAEAAEPESKTAADLPRNGPNDPGPNDH